LPTAPTGRTLPRWDFRGPWVLHFRDLGGNVRRSIFQVFACAALSIACDRKESVDGHVRSQRLRAGGQPEHSLCDREIALRRNDVHVVGYRPPRSGAFESLKRLVCLKILQGRPTQTPIRVWVPGCATGEEAFSIAIPPGRLLLPRRSRGYRRSILPFVVLGKPSQARSWRCPQCVPGQTRGTGGRNWPAEMAPSPPLPTRLLDVT
jgi:hypothetical protein